MSQSLVTSPLPALPRSEAFAEDLDAAYVPAPLQRAERWPLALVTVVAASSLLAAFGLTFAGVGV